MKVNFNRELKNHYQLLLKNNVIILKFRAHITNENLCCRKRIVV